MPRGCSGTIAFSCRASDSAVRINSMISALRFRSGSRSSLLTQENQVEIRSRASSESCYSSFVRIIERIHSPSRRDFEHRFLGPEQPMILTGVIDHWRARNEWTPEYFKTNFGQVGVNVESIPYATAGDSTSYLKTSLQKQMTIEQYLRIVAADPDTGLYLTQQPILKLAPHAQEDLGSFGVSGYYSEFLFRKYKHTPLLWIGPAGATSALHFDSMHNFNVQLFGRKKWVIFPREQQDLLYVPSTLRLNHFSPINYESPDLVKFPKYRQATPIEFVLNPGEVIFLPYGWVHYVQTLEFSITLNYWFVTWKQYLGEKFSKQYLRGKLSKVWRSVPTTGTS